MEIEMQGAYKANIFLNFNYIGSLNSFFFG